MYTDRNLSSTLYDPFSQGTSSNGGGDPSSMGECHVSVTNGSDGELPPWPQPYTSSGHHSTLMQPSLMPQYQVINDPFNDISCIYVMLSNYK